MTALNRCSCVIDFISREDLQEIFEPLLQDITKLVGEQVSKVLIKRMKDGHPGAHVVKASLTLSYFNAVSNRLLGYFLGGWIRRERLSP